MTKTARNVNLAVAIAVFAMAAARAAEKIDLTVTPEKFTEKRSCTRNWTQRTNCLFSVTAEGVDDIHLAYVGDPSPVIVISNRTDAGPDTRSTPPRR